MEERQENFLQSGMGTTIRVNRLRAGMTQVQLARAISRSGKFLSEVESGKARITSEDLHKLAQAMGVACTTLLEAESGIPGDDGGRIPRRIRDVQPIGMSILSFGELLDYLERSRWLRGSNLWMMGSQPFAEERDLALVEQLASLVATKDVSLRYVFEADRLNVAERDRLSENQGRVEALPSVLLRALRWSSTMRSRMSTMADPVVGYVVSSPLPALCHCHTLLWVETEDVSWNDVMPLLYCRGVTRTFEKPNESTAFWYHLPRDDGSKLLLEVAHQLKALQPRNGGL